LNNYKNTMPLAQLLDEAARIEELYGYRLIDTEFGPQYQEIVKTAAAICETPISAITLLDQDFQWLKAEVGIDALSTPRDQAICNFTIAGDDIYELQDTHTELGLEGNPLVYGERNFRFYAGVPLTTPQGYNLGALCVIDNVQRKLTDVQKSTLKLLAKQVTTLFELQRQSEKLAQHAEFIESFEFARRMQQSSLPDLTKVSGFENSFVLYQPQKLVGGNFYWAYHGNLANALAIGATQAHGMPGALVANMTEAMLEGMVRPEDVPTPDIMLRRLARQWEGRAQQRSFLQNERVSLGILMYDTLRQQGSYSGANQDLFIVDNGMAERILGEQEAIGTPTDPDFTFTRTFIDLKKSVTLYMASPGFCQQPSPDGEPFGKERMLRLFESIANLTMPEQQLAVADMFNTWRGTAPQNHDVCLIGFRVN
jgi:serine phosphatase RsbU (regulator of sigma subunit)